MHPSSVAIAGLLAASKELVNRTNLSSGVAFDALMGLKAAQNLRAT